MKIRGESTRTWLQAAGLGAVAGLRSMLAPATVAARLRTANGTAAPSGNLIRRLLATPAVGHGLRLGAALELVGDKLPFIPARISPLPLIGRAAWGALVAVAWTDVRRPRSIALAALMGGAAAAGAAFGAYELRKRATVGAGPVAKVMAGAMEDLVAAAAAYLTSQPRLAERVRRRTISRSKGYAFH
jgi:uncharacterized membrane protein